MAGYSLFGVFSTGPDRNDELPLPGKSSHHEPKLEGSAISNHSRNRYFSLVKC